MKKKSQFCFMVVLIILLSNLIFAIDDVSLNFDSAGTQYVNITIDASRIKDFSYQVNGYEYNSDFLTNVTVDFCDDSIHDWEYVVYDSQINSNIDNIVNAWSNETISDPLIFKRNIGSSSNGETIAVIQDGNVFINYNLDGSGNLGLYSIEYHKSQMLSITTENKTIHAVLPEINPGFLDTFGLYIAQGGSTYYCHSQNLSPDILACDMDASTALTSAHLAKNASLYSRLPEYKEKVKNINTLNSINNQLSLGERNITIKVTSQTPGGITFSNFSVEYYKQAPVISIDYENPTQYGINIDYIDDLTSTNWMYGIKPKVYVVGYSQDLQSNVLTPNQVLRWDLIKNNLKDSWDALTNNSHPMDFIFLDDVVYGQDFYEVRDFINDNFVQEGDTNIILALDLFDSSGFEPMNYFLGVNGTISIVHINGFLDSNERTNLYKYDEELLLNVVLHELMHGFVYYEPNGNLFYANHPASFTNLAQFETYDSSQSPSGNEGYYEIYSVLNQVRPYIAREDIGNRDLELSSLDKMLLGTLSPYASSNYSFYSAEVTNPSLDRFYASDIVLENTTDAGLIYDANYLDKNFWDITTASTLNSQGNSKNFTIDKLGQNDSALWVFANDGDNFFPNHFKVFNNNAQSSQIHISNDLKFLEYGPFNYFFTNSNFLNFTCNFSDDIEVINVSLYVNGVLNETRVVGTSNGYEVFEKEFESNDYFWHFEICDSSHCIITQNRSFSIGAGGDPITPNTSPRINIVEGIGNVVNDTLIPKIRVNLSDDNSNDISCQLFVNDNLYKTFNVTSNAFEDIYFENLLDDFEYNYSFNCFDGFIWNSSQVYNFTLNYSPVLNFNESIFDMNVTTNFTNYLSNKSQLKNLSNVVFKNEFGMINYTKPLDVMVSIKNLTNNLFIENKKIQINSNIINGFNSSAIITFYNISFINPYILKNNVHFNTDYSYNTSLNILEFNVSSFSIYSVIETPTCSDGILNQNEVKVDCGGVCPACPSSGGGSGGGGGGGGSKAKTSPNPLIDSGIEDKCEGNFVCGSWGKCIIGVQIRSCEDSNNCSEKRFETKKCVVEEIAETSIYSNAKLIDVKLIDEKYVANLSGEFDYVYFENNLPNSLIIYDEFSNEEFNVSYLTTDSSGRRIYNLTHYEANEILDEEEILQNEVVSSNQNNSIYWIYAIIVIIFVLFFILIFQYFVGRNKNKNLTNFNDELDYQKITNDLFSRVLTENQIFYYGETLHKLIKFVLDNEDLNDFELREKLIRVGWSEKIIDVVISQRFRIGK